tara:strand:+ start:250 stop:573 length:324 start_codon:yes stop_codon:yes gene_type:complete
MKLYTNNKGDWVGTQADARKQFRNEMRIIEVPVDKTNLMAFLNDNKVGSFLVHEPPKPDVEPSAEILSPMATSWVSWASETLNRGDISEAKAMLKKGLTIQNEWIRS